MQNRKKLQLKNRPIDTKRDIGTFMVLCCLIFIKLRLCVRMVKQLKWKIKPINLPTIENPSAFDPGFFTNWTFISTKVLFGELCALAGRRLSTLFEVELLSDSLTLPFSFGRTSASSLTFCWSYEKFMIKIMLFYVIDCSCRCGVARVMDKKL